MITVKDVEHIAKLARLRLSEDEKQLYTEQLGKIIQFFDELKAIDTTGVEPMSHALALTNVMRDDEVEPPYGHERLLATAPARDSAFFRVPKIGD